MGIWAKANKAIDLLTEFVGWIGWIILLYIMSFGVANVFMRYALNSASIWIGTTIQAAMVILACLSGPYALKHGSFINVDLFYSSFSRRTKAAFDLLTSSVAFLYLVVLVWEGYSSAQLSFMLNEVTPTPIPIPVAPLKALIPITAFVVLLIVIRMFVNNVQTLIGRGGGHGEDGEHELDSTNL